MRTFLPRAAVQNTPATTEHLARVQLLRLPTRNRPPAQVTPTLKAPLVLFTYYNPILRRGIENFVKEIASAGVSGERVPGWQRRPRSHAPGAPPLARASRGGETRLDAVRGVSVHGPQRRVSRKFLRARRRAYCCAGSSDCLLKSAPTSPQAS